MDEPSKGSGNSWLWIFLAVMAVPVVLFVGCMVAVSSDGDDEASVLDESEARYVCEQFVRDRLKAPSTADFQGPTVTPEGDGLWRVVGTVDAENTFGAQVRLAYTCTVEDAGDGEATLVDIALD